MIPGCATAAGTARFGSRFPQGRAASFYRTAQDLHVSSIGIGTYLGAMDQATDDAYSESIVTAVNLGLNFIDTSLNYRHQRSERAIGAALRRLIQDSSAMRDELVLCTKAGYLVPNAVPPSLNPGDIVERSHCLAPDFLEDQLERSRRNLDVGCIDVFYLHNPETQLGHVSRDDFHARIRKAFGFLEEAVARGVIRFYGTATWDGYRRQPNAPPGLSLPHLVSEAVDVAGANHHFRFIQLPFNLAMPEAFAQAADGGNVLSATASAGITVVASASLLQARLARNLPQELTAHLPGVSSDAARALQFTRSTPGITVALVGMSNPRHVHENLELVAVPPLSEHDYNALYRQA